MLGIEYSPCYHCDKTKCSFCELTRYKDSQQKKEASEMRLIDADALRQAVESQIYWNIGGVGLLEAIDDAPTVDAVEVKHGRWILGKVEPGYCTPGGNRPWICSECGDVQSWRLDRPTENYCPNCGAKMDGDTDGKT